MSLPSNLDEVRLLNTDQAAVYLGVSAASLRTYRTRGGGPEATIVGRRSVRYRVADLEAWCRSEARTPVPAQRSPGDQLRAVS